MLLPARRRRQPTYRFTSPDRVSARRNPLRRELEEIRSEPGASLTASGELVRHGQATILRRLIQPWQIRSFGYYDLLGEIKYAAQFYSRALANLELFAAEINADGEPEKTENQVVIDALDRIRDPGGGGRSGLLADYGRLMFLVGEAYLFVSMNVHTKMEQWEMLSTDELRLLDGNYTRFKAPMMYATQFKPAPDDAFEPVSDDTAVAYRIWRRHPRYSQLADSTMEGILDLCEELVLLTQAVRARARSRLAGPGVMFIDDRISPPPVEPTPDEDPQEDPFIADFTEAATSPITDEGTASAVVPLITRVKVPDGMKLSDMVWHLQIIDPMQLYPETGLRMECIKRMAIGLDMPPEILLGLQDSNHWSAWQIDEQVWKAHLQPIANQLVEDLTSAYLGPYLMEQGVEDWDRYTIAYDASKIINHPDRTKDAKDLFDRVAIGQAALRDAAGFDETDAPTEAERAERIGILVHDASLAWYAIPSVKAGGIEPEAGVVEQAGVEGGTAGPSGGAEVEPGPPPGGPEEPEEGVVGSAAAMVEGAAHLGLLRAREIAGSRLRTAVRRDPDLVALIDGVHGRDVAATLGGARVRALIGGPKEADLVAGARGMILDALRVFGVDDGSVREMIADTIERHAVRTLYEARPQPVPPNFAAYVKGLIRSSNGGSPGR